MLLPLLSSGSGVARVQSPAVVPTLGDTSTASIVMMPGDDLKLSTSMLALAPAAKTIIISTVAVGLLRRRRELRRAGHWMPSLSTVIEVMRSAS
eukprot:2736854-Rhodomonas_salina.1